MQYIIDGYDTSKLRPLHILISQYLYTVDIRCLLTSVNAYMSLTAISSFTAKKNIFPYSIHFSAILRMTQILLTFLSWVNSKQSFFFFFIKVSDFGMPSSGTQSTTWQL